MVERTSARAPTNAYELGGHLVVCNVPLPTLRAATTALLSDSQPVVIACHPAAAMPRQPAESHRLAYEVPIPGYEQPFLSVLRGPEASYLMRVHGQADFVVGGDCETIACHPKAGVCADAIEQLLVDQILPRALQLRGHPCFHASAVELTPGRVVAMLGHSGNGKSTLCAALTRSGAPLVCDDCMALGWSVGQAPARPWQQFH